MEANLDAGYIDDRSSGSLALSRSKSGHQLPLQRVKSGAPTAAEYVHHHQPLDFSQSLSLVTPTDHGKVFQFKETTLYPRPQDPSDGAIR